MTHEPEDRPSRQGWPIKERRQAIPAHDHPMPKYVWGMVAVIAALSVLLGLLFVHDVQQSRYIEELVDYRNEQRVNDFCSLFEEFPQGGLLERPRAKFGCGAGNGYDPSEIDPSRAREQLDLYKPKEMPGA